MLDGLRACSIFGDVRGRPTLDTTVLTTALGCISELAWQFRGRLADWTSTCLSAAPSRTSPNMTFSCLPKHAYARCACSGNFACAKAMTWSPRWNSVLAIDKSRINVR